MTGQVKFQCSGMIQTREPDDLELGCLDGTTRHLDYDSKGDTPRDVISDLLDWIGTDDWSSVELDACDEPGRVDVQVYEDGAGDVIPDADVMPALEQQAAAKVAARLTGDSEPLPAVYLATYTIYLTRVTAETVGLEPYRDWPAATGMTSDRVPA